MLGLELRDFGVLSQHGLGNVCQIGVPLRQVCGRLVALLSCLANVELELLTLSLALGEGLVC